MIEDVSKSYEDGQNEPMDPIDWRGVGPRSKIRSYFDVHSSNPSYLRAYKWVDLIMETYYLSILYWEYVTLSFELMMIINAIGMF